MNGWGIRCHYMADADAYLLAKKFDLDSDVVYCVILSAAVVDLTWVHRAIHARCRRAELDRFCPVPMMAVHAAAGQTAGMLDFETFDLARQMCERLADAAADVQRAPVPTGRRMVQV